MELEGRLTFIVMLAHPAVEPFCFSTPQKPTTAISIHHSHQYRQIANLLKSGMAVSLNKSNTDEVVKEKFTIISQQARGRKMGIFLEKCTQLENSENPKCNIKGNVSRYGKYYRTNKCSQYNITILQLYLGDQWFCTEKEAQKAGFTKAPDCP